MDWNELENNTPIIYIIRIMFVVFGHVCKDVVEEKFVPGSGVMYGGVTLVCLKQPFAVVTKV